MEPTVGAFSDKEERELYEAIERDEFVPVGGMEERTEELRKAASRTLEGMRTRISIRVQARDLAKIRAIARERGIPYQTLINSIIHQYADGRLKEDA